jgi:hypothetical protein
MNQLKESYAHAVEMKAVRVPLFVDGAMREAIEEYERVKADLAALEQAANNMAIEAGIIPHQVDACQSVCGPMYQVELLRESELRFRRLSVKYEKLLSAGVRAVEASGSVSASADAMENLWKEMKVGLR